MYVVFRNTYKQYVNEIIVEPFKGKDLSKPDELIDHVSTENKTYAYLYDKTKAFFCTIWWLMRFFTAT